MGQKYGIRYHAINIKCAATYKHFKCIICNWDGPECACGACILCV